MSPLKTDAQSYFHSSFASKITLIQCKMTRTLLEPDTVAGVGTTPGKMQLWGVETTPGRRLKGGVGTIRLFQVRYSGETTPCRIY